MTSGAVARRRVRWSLVALATPGERIAAWLIDAGIFWVVWVSGMILLIETGELGDPPRLEAPRALVWAVIVWGLSRCYDAWCVSRWGNSAGRSVLGIEVRDRAGGLPSLPAAAVRSVTRTPALLLLGLGLVPVWSDPQRRAVHDRVARTIVVRTGALEPADDGPGGLVDDDEPVDATEAAIRRADLPPAEAGWLRAVAAQTPTRLDVAAPSWRRGDDPLTTRHRAFCLLLAALIARYPAHRATLVRVIGQHVVLDDVHGDRERYLLTLLDDVEAARRWLGLPETASVRVLVDAPARPDGARQSGTRARR